MPAVWNLLVVALTVASVFASTLLEPSEFVVINRMDPSPPALRGQSRTSLSCSATVTGWELIDTTTNKKVQDLVNGDIVYSANDSPSFSIRAVVSGSGTRSVRLTLNGGYTHTDIAPPYALCETNTGDRRHRHDSTYRRCDGVLTHGHHVVIATACCDRDRRGTCDRPATTLNFEIRSRSAAAANSSDQGSSSQVVTHNGSRSGFKESSR
jgi:hypothetical protein